MAYLKCLRNVSAASRPDGKTVTPTDDISIWLACGGRSEAYTSLSEVLNDSVCLSALISDNNAMDYLVRSTTWASDICGDSSAMSYIGLNNYASNTLLADSTWQSAICNSTYIESVLNVKVPVMTSNTTPSGIASVQGSIQTGDAYNAFDDDNSTFIQPNAYPLGVGYTFPNAVKIYCAIVNFTEDNRVAKAFEIQESSDSFSTVSTLASDSDNTLTEVIKAFNGTTNTSFRCYISSGVGSWVRVKKLQFYGRADI